MTYRCACALMCLLSIANMCFVVDSDPGPGFCHTDQFVLVSDRDEDWREDMRQHVTRITEPREIDQIDRIKVKLISNENTRPVKSVCLCVCVRGGGGRSPDNSI